MALSDLANRPANGPGHKQCGACWVFTQMTEDEARDFRGALANPSARYDEIYAEIDKMGYGSIDKDALRRHANGQCSAREVLRGKAAR